MSSIGQAVGGIVGGAIGFFVGGPVGFKYGAQIGMTVGGFLDPPKGPTTVGPRLDDLSMQTSTYGAFIPRVYGTASVMGNIFWLKHNKLDEHKVVTEQGGKGGPSATSITYTYSATFAVGLCRGPIDGIKRIWIGGQLWYDASSTDRDTVDESAKRIDRFTVYLGTETQEPDPLIQADKGIVNTPAYRGLAYIVFDDLPLEKYGNSLAYLQIKVEIVKDASTSHQLIDTNIIDDVTAEWGTNSDAIAGNPYDDYGYANFINRGSGDYPVWVRNLNDVNMVQTIGIYTEHNGTNIFPTTAYFYNCATSFHSLQYAFWLRKSDWNTYLLYGNNGNLSAVRLSEITSPAPTIYAVTERGGRVFCLWYDASSTGTYLSEVSGLVTNIRKDVLVASGDIASYQACIASDDTRVIVVRSFPYGTPGTVRIIVYTYDEQISSLTYEKQFDLVYGGSDHITAYQSAVSFDDNGMLKIAAGIKSSIANAIRLYTVDVDNETLVDAITLPHTPEVSSAHNTGASMRVVGNVTYIGQSDFEDNRSVWRMWATDILTDAPVNLSTIVESECVLSNMITSADIDVSELTDEVRGYRVSAAGPIRNGLEPLRGAWPFDVVQHGYQIKFKKRGSDSVATIDQGELDAREAGAAPGVAITEVREMDYILPRKVLLNYLDASREYDINQQSAERINTDAINEITLDMPIVFNAQEAKRKSQALLYMYWLERYDVAIVLPPTYLHLEPGDVITVVGDNSTYSLRLTSINYMPDGRMECRAKFNDAAVYTQVGESDDGESTDVALTGSGPTLYEIMDIPLMTDAMDTPGFAIVMTGPLAAWPGGVLFQSSDNGASWLQLVSTTPGANYGYAANSIGAHGGNLYDFSSVLSVRLVSGALSSVTEDQMFNGANWFAYGADGRWEIICCRNAVLQSDGTYKLYDFLRGMMGTEWATGLHKSYDRIIQLDINALDFVKQSSATIGAERLYRGITFGAALDSDYDHPFTYRGVNLECLSPCHFTGSRHPTTRDWSFTWQRRSRFSGWRDYIDAPLGEVSESYTLEIYTNNTYTSIARIINAATKSASYTSADQVTDFGSNQSTLYYKLYQNSATVGKGYALTGTITRS